MRKLILFFLLILTIKTFGQTGKFVPFKLVILKPDTAFIDRSLHNQRDSLEEEYRKSYYESIKQMEEQKKSNLELHVARSAEARVLKFKYYHTLSEYSSRVYNFFFNEYEPYSTITELEISKASNEELKKIADSVNADYIVFFTNIHSEIQRGLPLLKVTTSIYSKKEDKNILTEETEGDTNSRGDMWTCGSSSLSCLLINAVRTSVAEVAPEIVKRQLRK